MPDYDVTDQVTWWFGKWIFQGRCYTQDGPSYNHLCYTQDGNLTSPEPSPNSLMVTVTLVRSLNRIIKLASRKSPLCFQKYTIISVGRLLICIVLLIAKTDRSCMQDGPAYNQCVFFKLVDGLHCGVDVVSPRTSLVVGPCRDRPFLASLSYYGIQKSAAVCSHNKICSARLSDNHQFVYLTDCIFILLYTSCTVCI